MRKEGIMFVSESGLFHWYPEVISAGGCPGMRSGIGRNVGVVVSAVTGRVRVRMTASGMRGVRVAVCRQVAAGQVVEITEGTESGIWSRVSGVGNQVVLRSVAA